MKILTIIHARGNSKGIPQKNLRPLSGKPLINYVLETVVNSSFKLEVYVSSEDINILNIAKNFGVGTIHRNPSLSHDDVTLDPVIYESFSVIKKNNITYDAIITMQPTSPLLKSNTLDEAINYFFQNNLDTLISARESAHLEWKKDKNKFIPIYDKRVNRQYLMKKYIETGGFLITKPDLVKLNSRIGKKIDLFLLKEGEDIDIDTYLDWVSCEYLINRKNIGILMSADNRIPKIIFEKLLQVVHSNLLHNFIFISLNGSNEYNGIISSLNYKLVKSTNLNDLCLRNNLDFIIVNKDKVQTYSQKILNEEKVKVIDIDSLKKQNLSNFC